MHKVTSFAATLALATAAALPAPAQAETNEAETLAQILFGVATIALLAEVLGDDKDNRDRHDDDDEPPRGHPQPTPQRPIIVVPRPHQPPLRPQHDYLPVRCEETFRTSQGPVTLLDVDCLTRNYDDARRLPTSCVTTIRTSTGFETGFEPRCLARHGYELPPR